jgi:hypothetical protein
MKILSFALASSFLLASVVVPAWAQPRPGAYFSSQQLASNEPAVTGAVGQLNKSAGYLEVVNAHTYAVHRLPLAQVWGYTTAAGKAYRLVGRHAFAIERHDSLVVYSRQRTIQQSRSTHTVTEYFYSVGLDGSLLPLTRRGLRQRFAVAKPAPAAPLLSNPT